MSKNDERKEGVSNKEGEVGGTGEKWNHCGRKFFLTDSRSCRPELAQFAGKAA